VVRTWARKRFEGGAHGRKRSRFTAAGRSVHRKGAQADGQRQNIRPQ